MKALDLSRGGDALTLRLIRFVREHGLDGPGVYELDVLHDDGCPMLDDGGPCNCSPDIRRRV
jgi:hypothetical protein